MLSSFYAVNSSVPLSILKDLLSLTTLLLTAWVVKHGIMINHAKLLRFVMLFYVLAPVLYGFPFPPLSAESPIADSPEGGYHQC